MTQIGDDLCTGDPSLTDDALIAALDAADLPPLENRSDPRFAARIPRECAAG